MRLAVVSPADVQQARSCLQRASSLFLAAEMEEIAAPILMQLTDDWLRDLRYDAAADLAHKLVSVDEALEAHVCK